MGVHVRDFATGLRAALRESPDVILLGEMRDLETVEVAMETAETGHLVFSTLHTNSAAGAITRLRDMGVEAYLLASTLRAVMAQRLVPGMNAEAVMLSWGTPKTIDRRDAERVRSLLRRPRQRAGLPVVRPDRTEGAGGQQPGRPARAI